MIRKASPAIAKVKPIKNRQRIQNSPRSNTGYY